MPTLYCFCVVLFVCVMNCSLVTDPEETAYCREGALPEHQERVPQTELRRAGAAPRPLLQSVPWRLQQ